MDFHAEADKLMAAHFAANPHVMQASGAGAGANGILANLLSLLSSMGLSLPNILALGAKLIPFILSKDWSGLLAAVLAFFQNPQPAPGPSMP